MGVLGASFLDFLGNNANGLVIGKTYHATDLGYYNRGNTYPETIGLNIYNSINSVLLPTLASRQNDNAAMKSVARKVTSLSEYIILPMMFGLIAVSDKFVSVLLTDKWTPCIPIMICACLYYAINPVRAIGYSVFYAKNESVRCVRIETFRSIFMLINLGITIIMLKKSIYVLAAVNVVIALLVTIVTQIQVRECIGYGFRELLSDLLPSFLMSSVIIIVVKQITRLSVSDVKLLFIQIVAGIFVYIFLSVITKNPNFTFMVGYAKMKFSKHDKGENNTDE